MNATVAFPTGFPYWSSSSLNGWRRTIFPGFSAGDDAPRHAQAQAIGHGGNDAYPIAGLTAPAILPGELVITHVEILPWRLSPS